MYYWAEWFLFIVQVYRLAAVHYQIIRYSYLTRYSGSCNEISFDKKSASQIVSFKLGKAWKKIIPLSTWCLLQAFWGANWRIIQNMILKYVFSHFINLAPKM